MRHLVKTSEKFWRCWKREYLLELRETHRAHQMDKGVCHSNPVEVGEVVTIYNEGQPRSLWRLGRIENLMKSSDGEIRGASVRVLSKTWTSHLIETTHPTAVSS